MHIHILGICGTFMGSLAQLARAKGYRVTGADHNVYPPMSTQLEQAGIELIDGFGLEQLNLKPDVFVVGNVVSRGNPLMEAILDAGLPYVSGPQWLAENLLRGKWVLGVSGTHGKTTTATMLTWILEYAHMAPGYLIGGVPGNFATSARLGESDFFVIEADEYDTAFFDKRSKFVHYQPRTLVINNLEYDHADIFPDLAAIQTQFHHLLRTVPNNGLVISPAGDTAVEQVITRGCWTPRQTTALAANADWLIAERDAAGTRFTVAFGGQVVGEISWSLTGSHNMRNALSAMAAARHVGVVPELACAALCEFNGVKRRMEVRVDLPRAKVYDDFAHHPTAIATTLEGLRAQIGDEPILAVIEPRSNTMRLGVHQASLAAATEPADAVIWFQPPGMNWSLESVAAAEHRVMQSTAEIIEAVRAYLAQAPAKTHVVIMSNGGFEGLHQRLCDQLERDAGGESRDA
ncbi:UDP-N-acetylmuramate:L-alanyl-gamma-D-glutamyl-meso-diaminopimelate ligase [Teredinibacter turnerae]|uniref:UDP-N-acetylmuramate:L-alanyl-gamma-D-glutamyl- meso-diaminopimelate ligase n=1 Tax=Teredinibacter turnerae TaxID=2426 RepID=UPI00055B5856|nr:UDP-N-acetylmuramate:L-alanyl-gamma-D-glutamyl-meso-diaminopimelate ligase [Teredinibacter turnerae]